METVYRIKVPFYSLIFLYVPVLLSVYRKSLSRLLAVVVCFSCLSYVPWVLNPTVWTTQKSAYDSIPPKTGWSHVWTAQSGKKFAYYPIPPKTGWSHVWTVQPGEKRVYYSIPPKTGWSYVYNGNKTWLVSFNTFKNRLISRLNT